MQRNSLLTLDPKNLHALFSDKIRDKNSVLSAGSYCTKSMTGSIILPYDTILHKTKRTVYQINDSIFGLSLKSKVKEIIKPTCLMNITKNSPKGNFGCFIKADSYVYKNEKFQVKNNRNRGVKVMSNTSTDKNGNLKNR